MTKSGYDALLDYVCVGLGFCGCIKRGRPLHVNHLIPSSGPVTADQFVDWVFLADDINPYGQPARLMALKPKIRAAFIQHMGSETVDASLLQMTTSDAP